MSVAILPDRPALDELTVVTRAYAETQAFISLLAHELRTRLKVTERALSLAGEEGRGEALANTRTVQELVESLLELARGTSEDASDPRIAVERVLYELGASRADVVVADLPAVSLPQSLLETLLRNLFANALEAGASRLEVYGRGDGAICVTDDGPGVPARLAVTIFGVYSSKPDGAGLGLALCREILRRRGGDIWVELPSTFCFRLP